MELEKVSIDKLLELVQCNSQPYKDSASFRASLRYISEVDESYAKQLLYTEACEMWDKEDVDDYLLGE